MDLKIDKTNIIKAYKDKEGLVLSTVVMKYLGITKFRLEQLMEELGIEYTRVNRNQDGGVSKISYKKLYDWQIDKLAQMLSSF